MDSDTDKLLRQFVAEGTAERIETRTDRKILRSTADKVDHLIAQTGHLTSWTQLHEQKDDTRHTQLLDMLKGHGARLESLEKDAEDTGQHRVADLEKHLEEEKAKSAALIEKNEENRTWWVRHWSAVVIGALVTLTISGITGACTYVLVHH